MPSIDTSRPKKQPPVVTLATVRDMRKLTQKDLCQKVQFITSGTFTQGALAAIENGTRGASEPTLRALEIALEIPSGSLTVNYQPTHSRRTMKASA